ncbi:MAG: hypothetical protein Q8N39_10200 [Pelolinea sp.]|nr:hypothetical protein [Pelolinea sp.]
MKNNVREYLRCLRKSKNILISLLIGSLTGAAVILYTPNSLTPFGVLYTRLNLSRRSPVA